MTLRGYTLAFDWNNDGVFTGTAEDVTADLIDDLTVSYGWNFDGDSRMSTSSMDFALRNPSRTYAPDYTSSPIYPNVGPGRRARLQVSSGGTFTLIDGTLDTYSQASRLGERLFAGTVGDAWAKIGSQTVSTALQRGIRTGAAIGIVLDEIGWTGARDLDPGVSVLPFWWASDVSATEAISQLLDAEGAMARAWVQGGTFTFRDRHHRINRTASQTVQATFTNVILPAGSGPGGSFRTVRDTFTYSDGFDHLANSVSFTVDERRMQSPAVVWESDTPVVVPASSSTVLHVRADDPFDNAIVPVEDTDFRVVSGADPTSITLSRTSGQSVIITINGGLTAAVLEGFQLRANPVTVARQVKVLEENSSSITQFRGRYEWPRECPFVNVYDAQAIARQIVNHYGVRRPRMTFTLMNGFGSGYLAQMLGRSISDRITVRDDDTGFNGPCYIEQIQHRLPMPIGIDHYTTFSVEAAEAANATTYFKFDTAGAGFNQGVFGQ